MEGIVLKILANQIVIWFNYQKHLVFAPGKWKQQNIVLRAGDKVILKNTATGLQITDLLPRKNCLEKPKVSNVDEIVIVNSVVQPELNWLQLMKTLAFYESKLHQLPILIFTKIDLINNNIQFYEYTNYLTSLGYEIYFKAKNQTLDNLKAKISNKTICFIGPSGVGKSTLINDLDPSLSLKSNVISKKLNRGKNTTTQTQLLPFLNGFLVDTPGYSKFQYHFSSLELSEAFCDYASLKTKCKFYNCLHITEKDCQVKKGLNANSLAKWRYQLYLTLQAEVKNGK